MAAATRPITRERRSPMSKITPEHLTCQAIVNGKTPMSRRALRRGEVLLAGLRRCGHCGCSRPPTAIDAGKRERTDRWPTQARRVECGADLAVQQWRRRRCQPQSGRRWSVSRPFQVSTRAINLS